MSAAEGSGKEVDDPSKEVEGLPDFPELTTGEHWVKTFWDEDFLPWDDGLEPDSTLLKHFASKGSEGRQGLRVFFPMCGISPDMKWAAQQGHVVIGCEYAEKAGSLFAKNMNLTYTQTEAPDVNGRLFTYNNGLNLKMYTCDIFKFTKDVEGTFDIIWDSGAMVAVNQQDRKRYGDLLKSLLNPNGKLFIYGIDGDPKDRKGPPQPVTDQTIAECFGEFNAEMVDRKKETRVVDGVTYSSVDSLRLLTLK